MVELWLVGEVGHMGWLGLHMVLELVLQLEEKLWLDLRVKVQQLVLELLEHLEILQHLSLAGLHGKGQEEQHLPR